MMSEEEAVVAASQSGLRAEPKEEEGMVAAAS